MRFDIDQQDLINLVHDTRRGFDRARCGLIFSLSALAVIAAGAAFQVYRAGAVLLAAAPETSVAGFMSAMRYAPGAAYSGLAWAGLIAVCAFLAPMILRARRRREAARRKETLEQSLASGRFDYSLALDQLIVNGPLAAKKISWSKIDRIEKKKSSIIFRRKDGGLEFIPRNVAPSKDFYEQVMAKHGRVIARPCPFEEANHAGPLSITYEAVRADADEYFAHYFRRRDGRLNLLRRLCQWRPWAPILFTVFTVLFAACAFTAFRAQELVFAAMSLAFGGGAAAIFILNGSYFRGAAFPFRKDKNWPFAQTDLVTVTLSRNGVHHVRHGLSELIQWPAFERYFETRLYGYLVVSAKTVIPLPKRAFLSRPHYEKFAAFARRAIADAKHARSEEKRGRMMRTIGKNEAAATPKAVQVAPQPKAASAAPAKPARKQQPAGAKPASAKPANAPERSAPVKPAAKKPSVQKPAISKKPAPAAKPQPPAPSKTAANTSPAAQKPPVNTRAAALRAAHRQKKLAAQ